MPEGFDVTPDELRSHADRLDGLRERLDAAFDAASSVTLGTEAYGQICQFFVPIVQAVSSPGVESLSQAASAMTSTADGVRATATSYATTDETHATSYRGAR